MSPEETKTAMATWARVGAHVRCGNSIRTVEHHYKGIEGGVRLDRPVDGLVSWNVQELRPDEPSLLNAP